MASLSHYRQIFVYQFAPATGCIPAGIEWLMRYHGIDVGNSQVFQSKYDLQGQGRGSNNFRDVSQAVQQDYPSVNFRIEVFDPPKTGADKLNRVETLITADKPVLISVQRFLAAGIPAGFHIVPVVEIDSHTVTVSNWTGTPCLYTFRRQELIQWHNHYSGRDILYIA
jgi:hypothetical protein